MKTVKQPKPIAKDPATQDSGKVRMGAGMKPGY